jgi:hypothetical protein
MGYSQVTTCCSTAWSACGPVSGTRGETKRSSSQGVPLFCCHDPLSRRHLAWPRCIGKAFRITENRVSRNTRNSAPEDHAKSPNEIGAIPKVARNLYTQTQGNHAEDNTRPQESRCTLPCSLASRQPPGCPARPIQNEHEKSAGQDEPCDVQTIEVLGRAYEAQTNHKRSHCGATGMGEKFRRCGISFHASYDAFLLQENVVQHKLGSSAAGAKRSGSAETAGPAQLSILSAEPRQGLSRGTCVASGPTVNSRPFIEKRRSPYKETIHQDV